MKIFPYAIARIGGDTFELFTREQGHLFEELLSKSFNLDTRIDSAKTKTIDCLFEYIKGLDDSKTQNLLQGIRRDVFNGRRIKDEVFFKAQTVLPTEIWKILSNFVELCNAREEIKRRIYAAHKEEQLDVRKKLTSLVERESLKNGLIFSSRSLLERIPQYVNAVNAGEINAKNLQTEKGLLKYISRIYVKTTPFSSFTNLALAELTDCDGNEIINSRSRLPAVKSSLRINNFVFALLREKFHRDVDFYRNLSLGLNPSINRGERRFKFLVNKGNLEIFQYLERNPFLDCIYDLLAGSAPPEVFSELEMKLAEVADASQEELEAYILRLVNLGFIEIRLNISGLSPEWDNELVKLLGSTDIEETKLKPLIEIMNDLMALRTNYSFDAVNKRIESLDLIYDKLKGYLQENGQTSSSDSANTENNMAEGESKDSHYFALKKESIVYEDTIRNTEIKIDNSAISALVGKLNSLMNSLFFLDGYEFELERMKIYFKAKYSKDRVSALKFYEDYYRDFKLMDERFIEEKEVSADVKQKPDKAMEKRYHKYFKLINVDSKRMTRLKSIDSWRSAIQVKLDKIDISNTLKIDQSFIDESFEGLTLSAPSKFRKARSFGAFVQFLIDQGTLTGIVNGTGPGYGRMFGRFLHLFDSNVTKLLSSWNSDNDEDAIFAEALDASVFNANIHPPLLVNEIWMPGSNNSVPVSNQISVRDLMIRYNESVDELELFHKKTEKKVFVIDLGLQGELGRSKLFQMLVKFTAAPTYGTQHFVDLVREAMRVKIRKAQAEIIVLPRIVFEGQLVLSRKRWEISTGKMPFKKKEESDHEYFYKVNQWRMSLEMPAEIFLSVNPLRRRKSDKTKIKEDDYKPQYINFLWPQFVSLFGTLVEKEPDIVWIEEMLPDSKQLLKIDNERYVSEFIINWTN